MKLTSVREFRSGLANLTKKGELIIVTNHGKMMGCFVPFSDQKELPIELKKDFIRQLGSKISFALKEKSASEGEVLHDFKKYKKNRRRQ